MIAGSDDLVADKCPAVGKLEEVHKWLELRSTNDSDWRIGATVPSLTHGEHQLIQLEVHAWNQWRQWY
jgi:hypothetical protein